MSTEAPPFRREYTITSSGYYPNEDGDYAGDVMSLHVHKVGTGNATISIEGKVDGGVWTTLLKGFRGVHYPNIDTAPWEYIRLNVTNIVGDNLKYTLFGYEVPAVQDSITVSESDGDKGRTLTLVHEIRHVTNELRMIRSALGRIVGDNITLDDIEENGL